MFGRFPDSYLYWCLPWLHDFIFPFLMGESLTLYFIQKIFALCLLVLQEFDSQDAFILNFQCFLIPYSLFEFTYFPFNIFSVPTFWHHLLSWSSIVGWYISSFFQSVKNFVIFFITHLHMSSASVLVQAYVSTLEVSFHLSSKHLLLNGVICAICKSHHFLFSPIQLNRHSLWCHAYPSFEIL